MPTDEHLLVDFITEENTQLDEFYTQMNIGVLLSVNENVIQQYGVRSFLL